MWIALLLELLAVTAPDKTSTFPLSLYIAELSPYLFIFTVAPLTFRLPVCPLYIVLVVVDVNEPVPTKSSNSNVP